MLVHDGFIVCDRAWFLVDRNVVADPSCHPFAERHSGYGDANKQFLFEFFQPHGTLASGLAANAIRNVVDHYATFPRVSALAKITFTRRSVFFRSAIDNTSRNGIITYSDILIGKITRRRGTMYYLYDWFGKVKWAYVCGVYLVDPKYETEFIGSQKVSLVCTPIRI